MLNKFVIFLILTALTGCSANPNVNPSLGFNEERRVVIVGEKVAPDIAYFYQRTYDAPVWFTPPDKNLTVTASRTIEFFGPTRAMKVLVNELKSINHTFGQWEIIVPKIAEKYFLTTLKHMKTGDLAKARGMVVLIDSKGNRDIEAQVQRVTGGSFFVTYELHKDLAQ